MMRSLFSRIWNRETDRMYLDKDRPVGVFDSGVGGLTVVKEIIKNLPGEDIVYFGDTARVPYGSKSKKTVIEYSSQIVNFLKTKNVKTIVVACNTASALALETIEKQTDIPMLGVVHPGTRAAINITKNKRIGLVATSSTIESGLYPELIDRLDPEIKVYAQPAPLLCPLVEEGWTDDEITDKVIGRYTKGLVDSGIDTLILGCTHYPFLIDAFRRIVGDGIRLVNPAYETAISLKSVLEENGLLNDSGRKAEYSFYSSDDPQKMEKYIDSMLGCPIRDLEQIKIEKY